MTAKQAWRIYRPKMRRLLMRIDAAARGAACTETGAPFDLTDEEYTLALAWRAPDGKRYDVHLCLAEEAIREGEGTGLAFHLGAAEEGGRIIGDFCPGNYSPRLWCETYDELAERWEMFEQIDIAALVGRTTEAA